MNATMNVAVMLHSSQRAHQGIFHRGALLGEYGVKP
jgi:hypothetical protein